MSRTFTLPAPRRFTVTGTARASTRVADALLDAILGRGGGSGPPRGVDRELDAPHGLAHKRVVGGVRRRRVHLVVAGVPRPRTAVAVRHRLVARSPSARSRSASSTTAATACRRRCGSRPTPGCDRARAPHVRRPGAGRHAHRGARWPRRSTSLRRSRGPPSGSRSRRSGRSRRLTTSRGSRSRCRSASPTWCCRASRPRRRPPRCPAAASPGWSPSTASTCPSAITGSTPAALAQRALTVTGVPAGPALERATSVLTTTPGTTSGWNLDTLELSSPAHRGRPGAGGNRAAEPRALGEPDVALGHPRGPVAGARGWSSTRASRPGWHATVGGHDLGPPVLLDGGFTAWPSRRRPRASPCRSSGRRSPS